MTPNVYILATCRKLELLPYTLLVFQTIRTGFPTSKIYVAGNQLESYAVDAIMKSCSKADCEFENGPETIHHKWIESLVQNGKEPFWILDTDVKFWQSMEGFKTDHALAGRRIPEWRDEFTNAITRARLHTSLLYIDPVKVREAIKTYDAQFPDTPFNPRLNLFYPACHPIKSQPYFYDTCGLLYHAIGGQAFTDKELDCYDHLNFGTIPDVVLPRLKDGAAMQSVRSRFSHEPEFGRGAWRLQEEYYAARPVVKDGKDVVAKVKPQDAEDAQKWNVQICCGNRDAMVFSDCWYNYCHAVDDLIDTLEDGRPTMSKDQMISLFFMAAVVYNSKFYRDHQSMLFPIVLSTTNAYADSVAWEKSPKAHLRAMADVMRTCGNEMYKMIALICGGEQHMKAMGRKIMERDWLGQHDEHGKPT